MGKDFRVGLVTGVVLAGAALVWVATRPSLSPQARLAPAGAASSEAGHDADGTPLPWESIDTAEATPVAPSGPTEPPASGDITGQQHPQEPQPLRESQPTTSSDPGTQAIRPDLTIHELDEPIKTTRFHIVRRGETLSAVSQQYYGSQDKWRKIVTANQKVIKDPNRIAPGTKLIIPD